jgi:hypothetical protein
MTAMTMLSGGCSQSAKLLTWCTRWRCRIRAGVRVTARHHMWVVRIGGIMSWLLVMLLLVMMIHACWVLGRCTSDLLMLLRR